MKLLPTLSWSALSTILKLSAGFIAIKVVAMLVGAKGVALIGQFQSFVSILMTIVLAGASSGLVKYTSEFKDNQVELNKIWSTVSILSIAILTVLTILLIIFHNYIALKLLDDIRFGKICIVLAFGLIAYAGNGIILNVLNGLHNIKKYTYINMIQSVLGVLLTVCLAYCFGVYGAILAIVLNQSAVFFVAIYFVKSETWFKLKNFVGKFDRDYCKKLAHFSLMSIVSMCVIPTGQIIIRSYLAKHVSWQIVGCYQGLQSLSNAYLQIVYLALGTYYLPKLSSLNNDKILHTEIISGYKLIMPFVLLSSLIIYTLRHVIIMILFAKSFEPMSNMFAWQFVGDFFKIASWILAYLMLVRAKTKIFIVTELVFGASLVILSMIFINLYGNNGAVIAFAVNYIAYFILFVFLYKKDLLI